MDKVPGRTRPAWRTGDAAGRSRQAKHSEDRRMSLLKRAGLFSNDTQGATISRATSLESLSSAYRLIHDVYVERGYIQPCQTGHRVRLFEALPETATFVANTGRDFVGVTTLLFDSPDLGLPSDMAFGAEIDALRAQGRRPSEGTNWAVAESHRNSAVISELMRCSFAHLLAEGSTDFLCSVSPGHAKFFGLLGFEKLTEPRSYSSEVDDPVVLVRLDLTGLTRRFEGIETSDNQVERFLKRYYIDENPYHRCVPGWQVVAGRLFEDPMLLAELFGHRARLLADLGQSERDALARRWGHAVLADVDAALPQAEAKQGRIG